MAPAQGIRASGPLPLYIWWSRLGAKRQELSQVQAQANNIPKTQQARHGQGLSLRKIGALRFPAIMTSDDYSFHLALRRGHPFSSRVQIFISLANLLICMFTKQSFLLHTVDFFTLSSHLLHGGELL